MLAAGALYVLAFAIAGLGGWLSYVHILVKAGTFARSVHPLPHGPMAACFVGWILVGCAALLAVRPLKERKDGVFGDFLGFGYVLGYFWLVLSCAFGASGYVLLGTLAGDVWGTYWAQETAGTVMAVVIPIVLVGNAVLYRLELKPPVSV